MNSLFKTRNQIILYTIILGLLGFIGLILFNKNFAVSFIFGMLISLGYLWHLGYSVTQFNVDNKSVNSIIRLALTIVFMVLIGQVLSLNIIFICLGFLCNHLAMLIQIGVELLKKRVG